MYKYKMRRCHGNKSAWCLVALKENGQEFEHAFSSITAYSVDALLTDSRLPVSAGDKILLEM
jgi:hypothetical protein